MIFLKQAVAVTVQIGPLVDAGDGATPETAVAFAAGELDLYKAGTGAGVDISGRTAAHIAGGVYSLNLLAADTDTLGPLAIVARDTAHRPWRLDAQVLGANAYDALCGGDLLWTDAREVEGSTDAAANLRRGAQATQFFTVGSGSIATRIATDLTETANNHWAGRTVIAISGTLRGQAADITAYSGTTKELTVSGFSTAPTLGDQMLIV